MLENEEFVGAFVTLPMAFFERIAVAAENHHQRATRYVDTTTMDGTMAAINSWLSSLEEARTRPYPSAEPGDLLVKLKRGEFWTFTVDGWRELAPIELVAEQAYDPTMEPGGEKVASPEEVAAMYRRTQAGKSRFFGRSVVEDELDRMRGKAGAPGVGYMPESGTLPRPWQPDERQQEILNELDNAANDIRDAIIALDGLPFGIRERISAPLGDAQLYADGIRYARLLAEGWMRNLYGPQGIA